MIATSPKLSPAHDNFPIVPTIHENRANSTHFNQLTYTLGFLEYLRFPKCRRYIEILNSTITLHLFHIISENFGLVVFEENTRANICSSWIRMAPSVFSIICILHSTIAITCGSLIMFYLNEISTFGHGIETARKLSGSTPHDQLLIQISNSFAGLLLFVIGFLLLMASFIKDKGFHSFFAKGCVLLHVFVAVWRICFERRLEDLASTWPRQVVGDFVLAFSWVFFLIYTWREKYD